MSSTTQQKSPRPVQFRVGGRLAAEISRIADREQNSAAAVVRRLIVEGLERARQQYTQEISVRG